MCRICDLSWSSLPPLSFTRDRASRRCPSRSPPTARRSRARAASRRDHPPRARAARPRPRVSLGRSPPRPRSSSRCVSLRARRAPGLDTLAAAPELFQLADGGFSPLVPILSVLGGFALAKAFVYWRVQFITASMIGKHVPPGARRVLEYGVGQGRNLYYYPKNVGMVVGVDPDAKEDLLVQVSVAASVPFVSKAQPLDAPTGQPDGTIDAVVTTGALGRVDDPEAIVREAGRVLKPGAPLVFVEDLSWGRDEPLAALTNSNAAAELFEPAQYDDGWATLPLAGVAIGVAVRKGEMTRGDSRRRGQTLEGRFRDSVGAQREAREAKEGSDGFDPM